MDLTLTVRNVQINPSGYKSVDVTLNDVDSHELLNQVDMTEIIDYYGIDNILHHIGESEIRVYLDE